MPNERCRWPDCTENRIRFSIFCAPHDAAHFKSISPTGAATDKQQQLLKKVLRLLRNRRINANTDHEFACQVAETIVSTHDEDAHHWWPKVLEMLPSEATSPLIDLLQRVPKLGISHGNSPEVREEKLNRAAAGQPLLHRLLCDPEALSRDHSSN